MLIDSFWVTLGGTFSDQYLMICTVFHFHVSLGNWSQRPYLPHGVAFGRCSGGVFRDTALRPFVKAMFFGVQVLRFAATMLRASQLDARDADCVAGARTPNSESR